MDAMQCYEGRVHKVGDHIDTDAIIPARFLVTADPVQLGAQCMAGLEDHWVDRVGQGDIMVAGRNFGCGSSREHAPLALLGAGIPVVVAHSFARIFYRNAFNMGLVLVEVGDAIDRINDGDSLRVDAAQGELVNLTTGQTIPCAPLPPFMADLVRKGGLVPYVKEQLEARQS